MTKSHVSESDVPYFTVTVERRNYGRRYTWLPVDTLDQQSFTILCDNTYMRPHMYDLQRGDIVRWKHNGVYLQGTISQIERTEQQLCVRLTNVAPLPADFVEL